MRILLPKDCPICKKIIYKRGRLPLFKKGLLNLYFWRTYPTVYNEFGRDFWLLLTDGSLMRVAICKKCYETLDNEKVYRIFDDITYTKLLSIFKMKYDENKKYKLFRHIRQVGVWQWAGTRDEIEFIRSGKPAKAVHQKGVNNG